MFCGGSHGGDCPHVVYEEDRPKHRVKAWRKPNEDGVFRMMRADGKLTTFRRHFGEEWYRRSLEEWEKRAAEVLNRAFEDPKWQ